MTPMCDVCNKRPPKSLLQTRKGDFAVCKKCGDAMVADLIKEAE